MNLMNLGKIGIAMTIAAGGLIAVATPAVAGTVLGGASVSNGARGTMNGKVVDGPVKVVIPKARGGSQFDIMAANINLPRSEEHTSELQSLMRISYAVFCLKKKKKKPIR